LEANAFGDAIMPLQSQSSSYALQASGVSCIGFGSEPGFSF
jgi:hypothetical protein